MKTILSIIALLAVNTASADIGAINYLYCAYEVSADVFKNPITSVAEPEFYEDKNGDSYAKSITVSMTYKNAAGKKFLTNGVIDTADYSNHPVVKFSGKTSGGKAVVIEILDDVGNAKVTVNGVKQTFPSALTCGYGLAG